MNTQPLLYVGSVAGGHHKQIIQEATGTTVALVYDNDDTAEGIVKSINVAPKLAEALGEALAAFDGEEESVKEEHAELMIQMRNVLREWDAQS